MSPTHAVKDGKRYRYYISRPLVTEGRVQGPRRPVVYRPRKSSRSSLIGSVPCSPMVLWC